MKEVSWIDRIRRLKATMGISWNKLSREMDVTERYVYFLLEGKYNPSNELKAIIERLEAENYRESVLSADNRDGC